MKDKVEVVRESILMEKIVFGVYAVEVVRESREVFF